jgi:hypothetical protein
VNEDLELRCSPYLYAMDFLDRIYDHPLTWNYDCDNTGTLDFLFVRLHIINVQTNERFYIGIGPEGYNESALGHIDLFLNSCLSCNLIDFESIAQLIFTKIS